MVFVVLKMLFIVSIGSSIKFRLDNKWSIIDRLLYTCHININMQLVLNVCSVKDGYYFPIPFFLNSIYFRLIDCIYSKYSLLIH